MAQGACTHTKVAAKASPGLLTLRSLRIPAFVLLLLLDEAALATLAAAQQVEGVEAPAEYQRGVEQRNGPSGTTDETDAAEAQAEAAKSAGGEAPGLGRKATARVEEIVVTARKREEALEDTPVAVTALGATSLSESSVTRIDQLRELVPSLHIQADPARQHCPVQHPRHRNREPGPPVRSRRRDLSRRRLSAARARARC